MIQVLFPPITMRNYKGYVTAEQSFLQEIIIPDEVIEDCGGDEVEAIKNICVALLMENKYPSLENFLIIENTNKTVTLHWQIPAWAIMPDNLEYDETPVSYMMRDVAHWPIDIGPFIEEDYV